MPRIKRTAFSMIEFLMVGVIVSVLLGLVFPALGQLRGLAGRGGDNNNLRQIALGLHSYHDTHRRFPPAYGSKPALANKHSIHIHLLPFVNQRLLFRQIQNAQGVPAAVKKFRIKTYNSPSDSSIDNFKGIQNYNANLRIFGKFQTAKTGSFPSVKGAADGRAAIQRIIDGTSNTMIFSTGYGKCNRTVSTFFEAPGKSAAYFGGKLVAQGMPFQAVPEAGDCDYELAQSFEKRGILVALADGSTRTVNPSINNKTWARALSANDNIPNGADW